MGPRCRRFESFRPDQKIQTVANAAVLIFCLERADSNDKPPFVGGSNLSLGRVATCVYPRSYSNGADACSHILGFPRLMPVGILVVIRTALTLVLIYSDLPRLKYAACAENVGFYIQKCTVCDFAIAPNPPKSQI